MVLLASRSGTSARVGEGVSIFTKKWVRGKRFVIITAENYRNYVTLPTDIEKKHDRGIIPNAHFTDLIRLELLIKY